MIGLVAYDLVAEPRAQFAKLEQAINASLSGLGYGA
jgi:hypothetical protein